MVAIVLLTTLITPLALRAAFLLKSDDGSPPQPQEVSAPAPAETGRSVAPTLNPHNRLSSLALNPGEYRDEAVARFQLVYSTLDKIGFSAVMQGIRVRSHTGRCKVAWGGLFRVKCPQS